jgi:hypothetical protein
VATQATDRTATNGEARDKTDVSYIETSQIRSPTTAWHCLTRLSSPHSHISHPQTPTSRTDCSRLPIRVMEDIHPANRISTDAPPPSLATLYPVVKVPHPITRARSPEVLREPPLSLLELDPTPQDIPKHVKPSIINVNELAPKQKACAYASAVQRYDQLKIPEAVAKHRRIVAFLNTEKLGRTAPLSRRVASAPVPPSPGLEAIHDMSLSQQKCISGRSLARLIVSAPPAALNVLDRKVPGSPMGNAWSGEHYWAPQFSPQIVTRQEKNKSRDPEDLLPRQSPQSQVAYHAVLEDVKFFVDKVMTEAESRGYPVSTCNKPETEVLAAKKVLEDKNAEFARESYTLPAPRSISSRIFELAQDESRAMVTFCIQTATDLSDVNVWMRVDESNLQISTILDSAREAVAMIKERRKSRDLEVSGAAWGLVHAVCLLDKKQWKLENGFEQVKDEESDSSDGEGYEFFLKSIKEEIRDSVEREKRRELGKSRMRGLEDSINQASHASTHRASRDSTNRTSIVSTHQSSKDSTNRKSITSNGIATHVSQTFACLTSNNQHSTETHKTQDSHYPGESVGHRNISLGISYDRLGGERVKQNGQPNSRRHSSLGSRVFDIESRKNKGKAPSVLDLALWAEELKNLERHTGEKMEDMEDGVGDEDEGEAIGAAITKD